MSLVELIYRQIQKVKGLNLEMKESKLHLSFPFPDIFYSL